MSDFFDLRVRYRKRGSIRYISHLDMNRMMQRAIARARLPVWYTQGYNPHLYLTFALPLSLGFESECEFMDLRLVREMPEAEFISRLGGQMPQGVELCSVRPPVHDVRDIAWCDWEVCLPAASPSAALEAFRELLDGPIEVEKKTKRGMSLTDIRPMVSDVKMRASSDALKLSLRCRAGSETNLNPTLLLSALCARTGDDARDADILRTAVLCADGTPFC